MHTALLFVVCGQVYELCLHYTNHSDHNVVNAALETLHQLLQSPPLELLPVLLSSQGVTRSRIQAAEGQEKLTQRSLSKCLVISHCTKFLGICTL